MGSDEKTKNDIIRYSAGGLRDFTRIAASDPTMWKDIFIDNSENILNGHLTSAANSLSSASSALAHISSSV